MKKKLMIGLITGTAVFAAVFGAAATLGGTNGITSQSLGANNKAVASCDTDGVSTSYTVSYTTGGYQVSGVTVSNIDPTCASKTISIQLTGAADAAVTGGAASVALPADLSGGSVTLGSGQGLGTPAASAVQGIHVAIQG